MTTITIDAEEVGTLDEWTLVAGATKPQAVWLPDDANTTYLRCTTTSGLTQAFISTPAIPVGSVVSEITVTARVKRGDASDANFVVGYSFNKNGGGTQSGESGTLVATGTFGNKTYTDTGLSAPWSSGIEFYIRNTQTRRIELTTFFIDITYTVAPKSLFPQRRIKLHVRL